MSKDFSFSIRDESKKIFFPHVRIKDKVKIIEILMEACRYLLHEEPTEREVGNLLVLKVEKMSRLFFIENNRYYSIGFPFNFHINDSERRIIYKDLLNIDSKLISDVISIIKDVRFESDNFLDFADTFAEIDDDYLGRIWILFKDLLMYEDGYLRIDYDPVEFQKAKNKNKEHTHPENHIDLFYSNGNTFKLGLMKRINKDFFVDLLNTKTDCTYLEH